MAIGSNPISNLLQPLIFITVYGVKESILALGVRGVGSNPTIPNVIQLAYKLKQMKLFIYLIYTFSR